MTIINKIFILIVSFVLVYLTAYQFGNFYIYFFPGSGGSFVDGASLVGLPLAYTFFVTLLFSSFGERNKYVWIGILLVPAVIFEIYFDFAHLYFPVALGIAGWLLGMAVEKTVMKLQKR